MVKAGELIFHFSFVIFHLPLVSNSDDSYDDK
jgi:hypothetical protein